MTGPLRFCGRAECRLCHPIPAPPEERLGLAEAFIGMAAIVLLFAVLFIILPVLR